MVELRTTTDTELPGALQQLGYDESFLLQDIKLGLGLATVGIAGGLFYMDKKLTFQESYNYTVLAIVVYFLVCVVLYGLNNLKSLKNVKYVGLKEGNKDKKISIATWTKGYDALYHVKIIDNQTNQIIEASLPFNKFFDGMGYYNSQAFIDLFKLELAKLGKKNQ